MQVSIIQTTWQEDNTGSDIAKSFTTQLYGACAQQTTQWSHGEESHHGPNTRYSLVAMDVR